jgi:hypothetical protein
MFDTLCKYILETSDILCLVERSVLDTVSRVHPLADFSVYNADKFARYYYKYADAPAEYFVPMFVVPATPPSIHVLQCVTINSHNTNGYICICARNNTVLGRSTEAVVICHVD